MSRPLFYPATGATAPHGRLANAKVGGRTAVDTPSGSLSAGLDRKD
jgi:hypothetical protein